MRANNEKITHTLCQAHELVFYPKSIDEAVFIQRQFLGMGYRWSRDDNHNPLGFSIFKEQKCVDNGMLLKDGKMFLLTYQSPGSNSLICTSDQFAADYASPDRAFMLEQFNKLAARIEEIGAKVDTIYKEIHPVKLDKPGLKNPNGAP